MSPETVVAASGTGCAVLALWLVVRFPGLGPQALRPAMLLSFVAMAALDAVGPLMRWGVGALGSAAALLLFAAPIITFAFWSGGVVIRAFTFGMGNGLPGLPRGDRTPAWARIAKRRRGAASGRRGDRREL